MFLFGPTDPEKKMTDIKVTVIRARNLAAGGTNTLKMNFKKMTATKLNFVFRFFFHLTCR
jgi:hypothetical protein